MLPFHRLVAFALAAALLPGPTLAGTLARPDDVDGVQLDPASHRLQLLLILDDDHVDSRQAMHSLYAKLNRYERYIASGQALKDAANANTELRPAVVILAPTDASSGEMQNLAGVKMAYGRHGAEIDVQTHVPGLRARPRHIDP